MKGLKRKVSSGRLPVYRIGVDVVFSFLQNVCDDLPGTGGATDAGEAHSIWRDNGGGLGRSLCSRFFVRGPTGRGMSLAFVMIAARSNSFCWISFFPGGCRKARGWGRPKSYQAEALEYIFRGAVGFRLESHAHLRSLHALYRCQWDRSSRHSLVGNHGPAILFVARGDPLQ